jgi:hypothetical protein
MADSKEIGQTIGGCGCLIALFWFMFWGPNILFNDSIDAVQELTVGEFKSMSQGSGFFGNVDDDDEIEDLVDDFDQIKNVKYEKFTIR